MNDHSAMTPPPSSLRSLVNKQTGEHNMEEGATSVQSPVIESCSQQLPKMPWGRVCENVEDFLDTSFLSLIYLLLQLGAIAIHYCRALEANLSHMKLSSIWPQRGLKLTWKNCRGLVLK